jgi:hypothetical protein
MDVTLQFYVFLIHVFFILQIKETLNVSSSKKGWFMRMKGKKTHSTIYSISKGFFDLQDFCIKLFLLVVVAYLARHSIFM